MNYRDEVRRLVGEIAKRKGIFGSSPASPEVERIKRLDFAKEVFWAARNHTEMVFGGLEGIDAQEAYQCKAVSIFEDILEEADRHYRTSGSLFRVRDSRVGSAISLDYELAHAE